MRWCGWSVLEIARDYSIHLKRRMPRTCRIGVNSCRWNHLVTLYGPTGDYHHFFRHRRSSLSSLSLSLSFNPFSEPPSSFLSIRHQARERELPLLSPPRFFVPLYRVKREEEAAGWRTRWYIGVWLRRRCLLVHHLRRYHHRRYQRASTSTSASLRSDDEDSAASAKSFEEVSRQLHVLRDSENNDQGEERREKKEGTKKRKEKKEGKKEAKRRPLAIAS